MKYIQNIIIALSLLGLSSCINKNRFIGEQKLYDEIRKSCLDSTIFKDFPIEFSNEIFPLSIITTKAINHGLNYCGVFIQYKLNKNDISKTIDKYTSKYQTLNYNDSCLWKISRKNKDAIDTVISYGNIKPIPNLLDRNNVINKFILSDKVKIIILDYSFRKILSDKYNSNLIAPEQMKYGYSKGIIIDTDNEKIFFYLIIW